MHVKLMSKITFNAVDEDEFVPRECEADLYVRCLLTLGPSPTKSVSALPHVSAVNATIKWVRMIDNWYIDFMRIEYDKKSGGLDCPGYLFRRRFLNWCKEKKDEG